MASALAGRALAGGNTVEIIGRDRAKAQALAAALGGATVGTAGTAPAGDIVVIAVPYSGAVAVVGQYGDALQGKVIVDITNPITPDFTGFVTPEGSSGAEEIAKAAPADAHVVKAFNTLPSGVLPAGSIEGRPVDVFIAGDDVQAKARVSAFVESLGMRPMDAGRLPMARALENVTLLHLGLVADSVKHTNFALASSPERPDTLKRTVTCTFSSLEGPATPVPTSLARLALWSRRAASEPPDEGNVRSPPATQSFFGRTTRSLPPMSDYGHPLRFGTFISPTNSPVHRPVEMAQHSERLGFDLVTFQDHPYLSNFHDTWTLLSWVAAQPNASVYPGTCSTCPCASHPPCSPAQPPALTCSPVAG